MLAEPVAGVDQDAGELLVAQRLPVAARLQQRQQLLDDEHRPGALEQHEGVAKALQVADQFREGALPRTVEVLAHVLAERVAALREVLERDGAEVGRGGRAPRGRRRPRVSHDRRSAPSASPPA